MPHCYLNGGGDFLRKNFHYGRRLCAPSVFSKGGPWKDICQLQIKEQEVREKMIRGLSLEVGNGRQVHFWEDSWLPTGMLKDTFPRLFSVSNQNGTVIGDCGFWHGLEWIWNFQWRRKLFQWELELVNQLHEVLRSVKLTTEREDQLVWKFDKSGIYTTNSFVQVLQAKTLPEKITSYSFTSSIWRGLVPPRIELFTWFVLVGRVNTKERLRRLGVIDQLDSICVLCKKDVEDLHHLFLRCQFTWQVWCAWLFDYGRLWIVPGTIKQHFESWTGVTVRKEERKRWLIGFFAIVWHIWMERNDRIFRSQEAGIAEIINRSLTSCKDWSRVDPNGC
ncbi:uncharacterized protein LOC107493386 [Arachis duranensis]|uniref:Uncharacterized protein LOC107493386 n=1 Tax=Arachis duranensis TaxID=130453 RepID=A0A6P4DP36_ARADU|nr:uncharacterized protein LOC107493386 [Arachis duranensis]